MTNIDSAIAALKTEKEQRLKSIATIDKMIEAMEKMQAGDPLPAKSAKEKKEA